MSSVNSTPDLLLVGNASYANRGCEAIVRGTISILERASLIASRSSITSGFYGDTEALKAMRATESDARIVHKRLVPYPEKWSLDWLAEKVNELCGTHFAARHRVLSDDVRTAGFSLEIGGDNYTMDYGFPKRLIDLDRWLTSKNVPVIIWGASIGPFSEDQASEKRMMSHLATLPAVFVRESATFDYLVREHGLGNVHQFADPAFMLDPSEPPLESTRIKVATEPVGINVSPLFRAYRGAERRKPWQTKREDLRDWVKETAALVALTRRLTGQPVLLIPHVASRLPGIDDFGFLVDVHQECVQRGTTGVEIIDEELNAAQLKWIISRCSLLVAARTHATIAAFSTGVPTLSLGYSRKAVGINRDVFDTEEFCLAAKELDERSWVSALTRVLTQADAIRSHLAGRAQELKASACAAGLKVADIIRN
jgi:colanic acid/amylovoran biosynthesis protein